MHSPALLLEILDLMVDLSICDPHGTEDIQSQIDQKIRHICLLSKITEARVRAACASRYPQHVQDKIKAGTLIKPP